MNIPGRKKKAGVPLQGLIAHGLLIKLAQRVSPAQAVANVWVEIFSRDRSVKDPVARAHEQLCRADRRALGHRGYKFGKGTLAPSIRSRNAR
jgi:hypothetical protein